MTDKPELDLKLTVPVCPKCRKKAMPRLIKYRNKVRARDGRADIVKCPLCNYMAEYRKWGRAPVTERRRPLGTVLRQKRRPTG
jgi:hypothetical protein